MSADAAAVNPESANPESAKSESEIPPQPSRAELVGALVTLLRSHWLLAIGFVAVHVWLVVGAIRHEGAIFGDVRLYSWWAGQGWVEGNWPVLATDWIYPVGALVPIALLVLFPLPYEAAFVLLVVALNAVAAVLLVRSGRRGGYGLWWWLAFLALLGPISLGRLDGVVAPVILVALLLAIRRPRAAAALATVGAWVKIAPAAVFLALLTTSRRPWRDVVVPGALVSAVVVVCALAGGSGTRVFSVFGEQGRRGLQAESVFATPFSLLRLFGSGQDPVYNTEIYTFEFLHPHAARFAEVLDLLLVVAVAAIMALAWLAVRRGADAASVLLTTTHAILLALIVLNKVGSPQFLAWLAPTVAVVIAMSSRRDRRAWEPAILLLLVAAGLTHLLYPLAYGGFITAEPLMVIAAAVRNLLLAVLLADAVTSLVVFARRKVEPALA